MLVLSCLAGLLGYRSGMQGLICRDVVGMNCLASKRAELPVGIGQGLFRDNFRLRISVMYRQVCIQKPNSVILFVVQARSSRVQIRPVGNPLVQINIAQFRVRV